MPNPFDGDPVLFDAIQFALGFIQSETDPENLTDSGNHADLYFDRNKEDRETLFRILADYRHSLKATVPVRTFVVSEPFSFTFKTTIQAKTAKEAEEIYRRSLSECPRTVEELVSTCLHDSDPSQIKVNLSDVSA
jgi:hypothetical protein